MGFMFWALAGIPYVLFSTNTILRYLGMTIFVIIGIISFVVAMFSEQTHYKVLKKEQLLFDYECLKKLTNEYAINKKKYVAVAIPCTTLFIVGIILLSLTASGNNAWNEYYSFVFLGFAIAGIISITITIIKSKKQKGNVIASLVFVVVGILLIIADFALK